MNATLSVRRAKPTLRATLACLLVACGAAQAVSLNPRGLGQVLVYPYYTVNKGQDTLVSIGNASDIGQVVKVQFSEGMNGRIVLDFNLYLSPRDAWTGRVSEVGAADGAALHTADVSCLWPPSPPTGMPFQSDRYTGASTQPADGGPMGIARTREGFIRVFALGDIIPGSALDDVIAHPVDGGAPTCEPGVIANSAAALDVEAPSGNPLYGSASIVNVGEGTYFGVVADALSDFTDFQLLTGASWIPYYMGMANSAESAAGGAIAHVLDEQGHFASLDYAHPTHAVSAVFMAESLLNEYLVDPGLGAQTDWVVTFPTREMHVDSYFTGGEPIPPFPRTQVAASASVEVMLNLYDQEEGGGPMAIDDFGVPIASNSPVLPYQVNVLSFRTDTDPDAASSVLGSTLVTSIPPYGVAGWSVMDLASGDGGHALPPATDRTILHGLPVTGFMVYNIINSNAAPGRLANYGGAFAHRARVAHSQVPAEIPE